MKHNAYLILFGSIALGGALFLLPPLAYAHVGIHETMGFVQGILHPLNGVDHILAMFAVGLWAAQRGQKAIWLIPATFLLVMAIGGLLGTMGVLTPFAEWGIVLSVLILGLLVAAAVRLPLLVSGIIVGLFALFHGHTHGAEMSANGSGIAYGAGFLFATASLHALGIGMALLIQRLASSLVRVSGGAIALYGLLLFAA
jgi:urease accessory protein